MNAKLQIGNRGQRTELTGRSPLRWRRSGLDCSAIEDDDDEEEEDTLLSSLKGNSLLFGFIYKKNTDHFGSNGNAANVCFICG